jgi:hypothetical protein
MDWDIVGPMIVAMTFILTVGGVMVLRPISKRLTDLLELYARDRQSGLQAEVEQLRDLLETTNARMELLEERQAFTERLLTPDEKERRALPRGPSLSP